MFALIGRVSDTLFRPPLFADGDRGYFSHLYAFFAGYRFLVAGKTGLRSILFGVPIAYLWANANSANLEVSVGRPNDRLQEGQFFEERLRVRNTSWLAKLWLEVEDPSDIPGHAARRIVSLGPRASTTWKTSTLCERRGLFTLGPVRVTSGDPFGFFRFEKNLRPLANHPRVSNRYRIAKFLPSACKLARRRAFSAPYPLRDSERLRRARL